MDDGRLEALLSEAFDLVADGLADATTAFLAGDRAAARAVVARDEAMDALFLEAERLAVRSLHLDGQSAEATRTRLLALLVGPELERSGDLVTHIAALGAQGLSSWLSPRGQSLVGQMGEVGADMWRQAKAAWIARDAAAADRLRTVDDELDDLHVSLTAELAATRVSVPVAIEMSLVARFFERLGDHAVNVVRRLGSFDAELV